MKLICGLFGLENLYGGEITSYIEISKMAENHGFDSVSLTDHLVNYCTFAKSCCVG